MDPMPAIALPALTLMDIVAILAGTALVFVVGGPWYGPLFGRRWQALSGAQEPQPGHAAKVFAGAAVFGLLASAVMWWLVGPSAGPGAGVLRGLGVGLALGAGVAGAAFGINYLFAGRPQALLWIDAGYNVVLFAAMGAAIGALRAM
jgi:hypothetical protein